MSDNKSTAQTIAEVTLAAAATVASFVSTAIPDSVNSMTDKTASAVVDAAETVATRKDNDK